VVDNSAAAGDPGAPGIVRPERIAGVSLAELARLTGADLLGSGDTVVVGATLRAQRAGDGELFAALPGARAHGGAYAADAVARGAVAVLTDPAGADLLAQRGVQVPALVHPAPREVLGLISSRIYDDPSDRLTLIGITGTSGKTTTAYLTEAALRAAGEVVGLIGTVGIRIDGRPVPSALTTPEAPDLQRMLAVMAERGVTAVVMEVSSHALSLGRVDGCRFAVGGFTNLSQDHLDFHHTMEEYFEAKARLFDGTSPVRAVQAVICVDDDWGERMAQRARSGAEKVATVATRGRADWSVAGRIAEDAGTQTVLAAAPDGSEEVLTVPLPGAYNVANALLAVALAHTAGVPVPVAAEGLTQVAVPGRLEKVDRGQDFLAVVDYAHKPAAVQAVLETLGAGHPGRIAVVLGAGGDRDTEKRPLMGAAAARGADLVIVTDDNPRSEDPAAIRAAVLAGAEQVTGDQRRAAQIREIGDRASAIDAAVAWAQPGDIVLVAGKGHETGQQVGETVLPFDDRVELGRALETARAGRTSGPRTDQDGAGVLTAFVAPAGADVSRARTLLREMVAHAADTGAGSAHRGGAGEQSGPGRRTWAFFGELAADPGEGTDDNARAVQHDLLGRQAVRLAVDQTVAVGATRVARALHQGAVMEGSWGEEADFYRTPDELVAALEAGPADDAPRAGDVVVVAGGEGLADALLTYWRERAGLAVSVRDS